MSDETKLILFHNDCDWVVAVSPEDAARIYAGWCGEPLMDPAQWDAWGDDRPLTIDDDGDKTTLTGAEWAAKGRAYLGSTEY